MKHWINGEGRLRIALLCLALILAALVVRNALIRTVVEKGGIAVGNWLDDPQVAIAQGLGQIEASIEMGEAPPPDAVTQLIRQSDHLPLAPEPFLVAGIRAQERGNAEVAGQLLLAARMRDPRSPRTRFILADHYWRAGRPSAAMQELAAVMRLQKQDQHYFAPYFIGLTATSAGTEALRALFRSDPNYGRRLLAQMAAEGRDPDLILALAKALPRSPQDNMWQGPLLSRLLEQGKGVEARTLWASWTGQAEPTPLLSNPDFGRRGLLPPFDWQFTDSQDGIVQPGNGRVSILYYGRSDAVLLQQVLTLGPGRYRLWWTANGSQTAVARFEWRISCLISNDPVDSAPLSSGELMITITEACPAQKLAMWGLSSDAPQSVSAGLSQLQLEAAP